MNTASVRKKQSLHPCGEGVRAETGLGGCCLGPLLDRGWPSLGGDHRHDLFPRASMSWNLIGISQEAPSETSSVLALTVGKAVCLYSWQTRQLRTQLRFPVGSNVMKGIGVQRPLYVPETPRCSIASQQSEPEDPGPQGSVLFNCVFWNLFLRDVEPVIWQALFMG